MKTALFSAALLVLSHLSAFAGVNLGSTTSQTPYDPYMGSVKQTFATLHGDGASMDKVQALMRKGRQFRYAHTEPYFPARPEETAAKQKGDCKDKALWLIDQLQDPSARFVIGKEKRGAAVSHAWVMWQNQGQWWILDCTLNSKPVLADQVSINKYVPLYSWTKGVSFRHSDKATGMTADVAAKKQAPVAAKKGLIAAQLIAGQNFHGQLGARVERPGRQAFLGIRVGSQASDRTDGTDGAILKRKRKIASVLEPHSPDPMPALVRLAFGHGLKSLPRACGVLWRSPRILLWLMPPLLITLVLDGLAFYFAFGWIRAGIENFVPGSGYFAWLRPILDVLGALAVVFVLGWSFAWLFLTLTSPFQDFISAAVERATKGSAAQEPAGFTGFFRSVSQSVAQAIVLSAVTVLFLILGFIPLVGPVLFFLWSASVLGYSFIAIPSGRMAQRLSERLSFARRHRGAVLGLGMAVAGASLVPLVNVILMPIFVVAGTLLYLDATDAKTPAVTAPYPPSPTE